MSNENLAGEPLADLAVRIEKYANEADERTIEAAKLVRVARSRIENGEAGDVTWYVWAKKNIKLSLSRLRELQRIAAAANPAKELERLRRNNRERVERHRQKKKSAPLRNGGGNAEATRELEEDRVRLIEWARSAPLERVADVLSHIQDLEPTSTIPMLTRSGNQLLCDGQPSRR